MENHFAENLKYYRKKHKMTQDDLAEKLNITHQAISCYEKGLRSCNIDILIKLAGIFGISTDELISGNGWSEGK